LLVSTSLAAALGVGIALVGQARTGRAAALPLGLSVVLLAMPSFLIGGVCQAVNVEVAVRLGLPALPTIGAGWDAHLIMPALVLAARPTAYVARVTTRLLAETSREHFVRTAHAKGLAATVVLLRHTLRASAPGVLAAIVFGLRLAIGTLPIVEIVFVYPGMGFAFLSALRSGDVAPAAGLAMAIALTLWLLALAADAARSALDPRLVLAGAKGELG
jgi:ABC-type dipeptide/oligopeptide/nickel transport system permease component